MNKTCDLNDLEKRGYKEIVEFFESLKAEADRKKMPYTLDGIEWNDAKVKKWEMAHMLIEIPIQEGYKVLDAGSQSSLFSVMLAMLGCQVYPLDINPDALDNNAVLKQQFNLSDKLMPRAADIRHLPFPDNFFDVVFSLSVIEHIPNDGDIEAVKELVRVVKKGGLIGLTMDFYKQYIQGKDVLDYSKPILEQEYWWVQERIYDTQAVWDRIIKPSGCQVVGDIDYSYESPTIYNKYTMASLVLKKE